MDISNIILSGNLYKCHNQIMVEELKYYNLYNSNDKIDSLDGLYNINDDNICKLFISINKSNISYITSVVDKLEEYRKIGRAHV